jgi:hypothetical protein
MKILFQGGWRQGRNPEGTKAVIEAYCRSLARHAASSQHQLILSSPRAFDALIAEELSSALVASARNVKDALIYLLPSRYKVIPEKGRVLKFDSPRWWLEERTYLVEHADAVVAVGGGRGTVDCIQKALLARKLVFVAGAIPSASAEAWKKRPSGYHYLQPGDTDFTEDVSNTPDEFFDAVFQIINALGVSRYSRQIFVVHGRDYHLRDSLVFILRQLKFDPIVLQATPGKGRTIIENIEMEAANAGFAFVLYTPDDLGRLSGESEKPRARQNVVFEHGLLIGLLGRDRTCALTKGEVDLPADVHGLIYEPINDLAQESIKIARILKHAGYEVDASVLV